MREELLVFYRRNFGDADGHCLLCLLGSRRHADMELALDPSDDTTNWRTNEIFFE